MVKVTTLLLFTAMVTSATPNDNSLYMNRRYLYFYQGFSEICHAAASVT